MLMDGMVSGMQLLVREARVDVWPRLAERRAEILIGDGWHDW